jgi:hypothetical protein
MVEGKKATKCSNTSELGSCVSCSADGCPTLSDKIDTLKEKVKDKIKEKVKDKIKEKVKDKIKEKIKENKGKNPEGCMDFATIVGEDSDLNVACSDNEAGESTCEIGCPAGQSPQFGKKTAQKFFNYVSGKTEKDGFSVVCKCEGRRCRWNSFKGPIKPIRMLALRSLDCE